ncbi:MAG: WD40 repeat domain-containing protein [bacterium]|nr:WD40 repeat domain-containing protein [bacterium]
MQFTKRFLLFLLIFGLIGKFLGLWTLGQVFNIFLILGGIFVVGLILLLLLGSILTMAEETYDLDILQKRLHSRIPFIGTWLRRRTARTLAAMLRHEQDSDLVFLMAETLSEVRDKGLRKIIGDAFQDLDSQSCIDTILAVWEDSRHKSLTALLIENRWIAAEPLRLRGLSALKNGAVDLLQQEPPEIIEFIAEVCDDADKEIALNARQFLEQLQHTSHKDALCCAICEYDFSTALEISLHSGYLPGDPAQRAQYLFMTEQWDSYETLDFDYSLLRTAHHLASTTLRRRIAEKLRKTGRTEFLTVMAGADYYSRAGEMGDTEIEVMVQLLSDQQEWGKLWKVTSELPFIWALRIVRSLKDVDWQPEKSDESALLHELESIAGDEILTSKPEAEKALPVALQEATIKVKGRVNDVAFSPIRPIIALAGGTGKVGLWNFQRGEMEHIIEGFYHSVGLVDFLPDGSLICAERTNKTDVPCRVYLYRDDKLTHLGEHFGSVTAIEGISDTQFLSSGRDQKVIVWDVESGQKNHEKNLTFWARAAAVSPDRRLVALVHKGASILTLPELDEQVRWDGQGAGRCAAFVPDEPRLIVGKYSGAVEVHNYQNNGELEAERQILEHHNGRAQGLTIHANSSTVISAGSQGELHFSDWGKLEARSKLHFPEQKFTSLHTSCDGAFMATGNSDSSMTLWDLRMLDVPGLFIRPFAKASPDHLIAISELAADERIASDARRSLRFMQKILQYRFRFDIEIDEIPTIKAGEFDIEIE